MCFHVGQGLPHFSEEPLGLVEHLLMPIIYWLGDKFLLSGNPLPALCNMPHGLLKVCFSHGEPTAG